MNQTSGWLRLISNMAFAVIFSSFAEFFLIKNTEQSNNTDSCRLFPLCAFHTACSQVLIIAEEAQGA